MRLQYANGRLVAHTHRNLVVSTTDAPSWVFPVNPVDGAVPWCEHDILAVSPSGERIVVQAPSNVTPPILHSIHVPTRTSRRMRTHPTFNLHDLTFVDPTRVLATAADRNASQSGPALRQSVERIRKGWGSAVGVAMGDPEGVMETIPLPEPLEVAWPTEPSGIWAKQPAKAKLWHDARVSSRSTFVSNAHGHVLSDATVGLVIVFERDDPRRCRAYRVPSEYPEVPFTAAATRTGFVVAHQGGRSAGGINSFDFEGAFVGGHAFVGGARDLVVIGDTLLFLAALASASGDMQLARATLPDLSITAQIRTPVAAAGWPGLTTDEDASVVWIGRDENVFVAADGADWNRVDFTPPAPSTPAPPVPEPAGPRRVVHPKFGEGTVVSQEGEGEEAKLEIAFASGTKKLQAKFVRDAS